MHAKREPQAHDDGAIDALVEAERAWRAHLDGVRAEAARLVAEARAESESAVAAVQAELGALVERHCRELDQALARDVAALEERGRADARRFVGASADRVEALATAIARRAPWIASEPGGAP